MLVQRDGEKYGQTIRHDDVSSVTYQIKCLGGATAKFLSHLDVMMSSKVLGLTRCRMSGGAQNVSAGTVEDPTSLQALLPLVTCLYLRIWPVELESASVLLLSWA